MTRLLLYIHSYTQEYIEHKYVFGVIFLLLCLVIEDVSENIPLVLSLCLSFYVLIL